MSDVRLPALYLDHFETSDVDGLYLENRIPEPGTADVDSLGSVTFELLAAAAATGPDTASTFVYLDGVLAYAAGVWQAGFSGTVTPVGVPLPAKDLRFEVNHSAEWASGATVTVRVVSDLVGGGSAIDVTYTFTVEDYVAPRLLSAFGSGPLTVRLTFDEDLLHASASGEHDALNPALYAFGYVQAVATQAGVGVTAVGVTRVSAGVFDVTLSREATFWRVYKVTCGDIADASTNANLLDADHREAQFDSWVPPEWPAKRRFDLWSMLSHDDRVGDLQGDLARLVSVFQDVVDVLLYDLDRFETLWDVDRAPESFIDALLQDLGNPFRIADLDGNKKRKLVDLLLALYRQLGTAAAVENAARFFLGLIVTVSAYSEDVWVLDESELDVDTWIGPGDGTPELYTFEVFSPVELTDTELQRLIVLVRRLKAAHEHFVVTDPTTGFIDHWELDFSYLDESTFVH